LTIPQRDNARRKGVRERTTWPVLPPSIPGSFSWSIRKLSPLWDGGPINYEPHPRAALDHYRAGELYAEMGWQ
jgi:hypothetical protein